MVTEEIEKIFRQAKREKERLRKGEDLETSEDMVMEQTEEKWREQRIKETKNQDLSGSIFDCINRYSAELTEEQLDEIIMGLAQGLSEKEVKSYMQFVEDKM